ncbi:N-acetylneuraminic acid synthase domain-containing protein [Spirochaeta thermophila DSM 6578]|uniref:N-acetylneuraminic acid synthase domain-containing protein n=1 Tax=Winmispira thermophila (strain ATCC 700085 / DSM 6578 / Z-1203) TaxID=869211 RepID=G0GEB0_WINT7|nr:N-acetylneuraminate synthase family protein [Spirochaeta thermophila]AEJ62247.1 N-acetylneuraminic acid synthase domain-containing protein [Spirochaeta thermophila DSM 6578]
MDERQDGTIIVAEVGTGHHGEKERAEELIEAAREAGADWVKTQVVWAEEILHPRCGVVPLPGGPVSLYERFRSLEVPEEFYEWFAARALEAGMRPLFSVFGMRSAALMGRLLAVFGGEIPAVKIASPELVYVQLLDAVRRLGMPVVLSSGVSLLGDIETSIGVLRGEGWMVPGWGRVEGDGKGVPVTLLHCVTAYPAPEEDYNLRVLPLLAGLFGVPVGVSDHSRDPELIPATAVALGARMIEKHLCLSHEGGGLDDPVALEPDEFARMVGAVRAVEGAGEEGLRVVREAYGARVEGVLGSGEKRLAPAERGNYGRSNRSIHVRRTVKAGSVLREEDLVVVRTEKMLRPGLPPVFLPVVVGRRVAREVEEGEGLRWEDLLP